VWDIRLLSPRNGRRSWSRRTCRFVDSWYPLLWVFGGFTPVCRGRRQWYFIPSYLQVFNFILWLYYFIDFLLSYEQFEFCSWSKVLNYEIVILGLICIFRHFSLLGRKTWSPNYWSREQKIVFPYENYLNMAGFRSTFLTKFDLGIMKKFTFVFGIHCAANA
jgi:hypothetical protein